MKLGVYGILRGDSTGFPWLEMPRYAFPILFCSYALIGVLTLDHLSRTARASALRLPLVRRGGPLLVSVDLFSRQPDACLLAGARRASSCGQRLVYQQSEGTMARTPLESPRFSIFFLKSWNVRSTAGISRSTVSGSWRCLEAGGIFIGAPLPKWIPRSQHNGKRAAGRPCDRRGHELLFHVWRRVSKSQSKPSSTIHRFRAGGYVLAGLLGALNVLPPVSAILRFTYFRMRWCS